MNNKTHTLILFLIILVIPTSYSLCLRKFFWKR